MTQENPSPITSPTSLWSLYATLRLVSLDVVAGAVASGYMVAHLCGQVPEPIFLVVLGLAVWLIYTLDHLMDAYRLQGDASTPRHRFHQRYFKLICWIWAILAITCGGLALFLMDETAIWFGLAMGGFTLLHLALVTLVGDKTSLFLVKEMGVAFVYSAGIWGLPMVATGTWREPFFILAFVQFSGLVMVNLLEFSYFEYETDELDKQTSFIRAIGPKGGRNLILTLLLLLFGSGGLAALWAPSWESFAAVEGVFLLMWLMLASLLAFPRWYARYERYRVFGDGAFLIPFISWLWLPL